MAEASRDLDWIDHGFLGVLRASEGLGLGGAATRIYNDVVQRGRKEPITSADFSAGEKKSLRDLVLSKYSKTGEAEGSVDYPDYAGQSASENVLGGFKYKVAPDGSITIRDNYDFNTDRSGAHDNSAAVRALAAAVNPRGLAAHVGRKVAPPGQGVPVEITLSPSDAPPPDRWDNFKIAKDIADAWAGFGLGVLKSPIDAAENIAKNYRPGAENEPLNEDIGRQGMNASAALVGGVPRATMSAGGELGVASARIMQRADARKLIKDLWLEGKTEKQIAASLNERFAPLLDEGSQITRGQVSGVRGRAEKAGEYELGAAGGRGRAAPRASLITEDSVVQLMRELGYENIRSIPPKTGNSQYVYGDPPGNKPRSYAETPVVRVSDDGHLGRPLTRTEVGNRFDTGLPDPTRRRIDERAYLNQGGEPYADPSALEAALRWRRGDLVRPDQAPRGLHHQRPLEPQPSPTPAGPDPHPDQLKLLARGSPAPLSIPEPEIGPWKTTVSETGEPGPWKTTTTATPPPMGWQTTVIPEPDVAPAEGAGRFARPVDGDAAMLEETRRLTDQVRKAQRTIWDQFERAPQ